MASKERYTPRKSPEIQAIPFDSAQEAWFWFIEAQAARNDGARLAMGQGRINRPCEPLDILKILDRLYRNRRLLHDHLLVLRHYGRRRMAPDPSRIKEIRAHDLWLEAMERLENIFEQKGIVARGAVMPHLGWAKNAFIFEGGTTQ